MHLRECVRVFTACTIACSLVLCCAHEVDPRPARIAAFVQWAQRAGITMDGLEIRPWGTRVDDGYEVIATKAIAAGQPVFEVPRDAAVRVDSVHTDAAARLGLDQPTFWDGGSMEPKARVLAQVTVLAVYEAFYVAKSYWRPYWDILPPNFDHVPLSGSYTPFEVGLLHQTDDLAEPFTTWSARVDEMVAWATAVFPARHPDVFGPPTPANVELLASRTRWAFLVVATRAYEARREGDSFALVPLSDMLNHHEGANGLSFRDSAINWPAVTDTTVPIVAYTQILHASVEAGNPVVASYMPNGCNSHWVVHYGFADANPSADCSSLVLTTSRFGQAAPDVVQLLSASIGTPIQDGTFTFALRRPHLDFLPKVMALHRMNWFNAPWTEAVMQQAVAGPLSAANERAVVKSLAAACDGLVAEYSTKMATSLAALESEHGVVLQRDEAGRAIGRTGNERNILHAAYGKLRALEAAGTAFRDHWAQFVLSDFQDQHCC